METLEEKIQRVLKDKIELVPYDSRWPVLFEQERVHLLSCLPNELLGRIDHYGSTSIPGMTAKPVVDMLVEVFDLEAVREQVPPILEEQGYDYFWRPTNNGDGAYPWFIKRDSDGQRTHHIHMVASDFNHWEGISFRDYLRTHDDAAREYEQVKKRLATDFPDDRIAYTEGKTDFISSILEYARF